MQLQIKDILINYKKSGVGPPIIFLHGWGRNKEDFDKLYRQFRNRFSINK